MHNTHDKILLVHYSIATNKKLIPDPGKIAFGPIHLQIDFMDQELPYILIGQTDFLELFKYQQIRSKGTFELSQIKSIL